LPNRATGVYYVALFEIGLSRNVLYNISLHGRAGRAAELRRCMLTWRYVGLHTSSLMHFLRIV